MSTPEAADPDYDCLACGACCRDVADGTALVSAEDLVRWRREGAEHILASLVPGHFSQMGFGTHPDGTCVHFGTAAEVNGCSIYETRGECCHALVPGSSQCKSYRLRYFARIGKVDPLAGAGRSGG